MYPLRAHISTSRVALASTRNCLPRSNLLRMASCWCSQLDLRCGQGLATEGQVDQAWKHGQGVYLHAGKDAG